MGGNRWFILVGALLAGCASQKPTVAPPEPVAVPKAPLVEAKKPSVTLALLEPCLEPAMPAQMVLPPPSLGGRIQISPSPSLPLVPSAPPTTQTRPIPAPTPVAPPPDKRLPRGPSASTVNAMVQLLEDERSRSVEQARRQLSLATARVTQTAAEAKKTSELVRAGALAQFKATQADAASRDAVAEQADAQKTFDDAQRRVGEARRDVESTLSAVSQLPFSLAQFAAPTVAFRPVPFTYRLSVLGTVPLTTIRVEGGTLGRVLERGKDEAGAWIVRCPDPSKLRVIVGESETQTIVRSLPRTEPAPPRA